MIPKNLLKVEQRNRSTSLLDNTMKSVRERFNEASVLFTLSKGVSGDDKGTGGLSPVSTTRVDGRPVSNSRVDGPSTRVVETWL